MASLVQSFLLLQAAVFAVAALIHSGALVQGYEHVEARIAETVIGLVLIGGFVATKFAPSASRRIGLAVQAFALAGTMVGLFTIVIGVGLRTPLDLTIHGLMVVLLVWGLVAVARRRVTRSALPE